MPLLLILFLLIDLFSWLILVITIWLFREWYLFNDTLEEDYARKCLIAAIVLSVFVLLGKSFMKLILGNKRIGEEEPKRERSPEYESLSRADGSVIHIEFYGKKNAQPIVFIHGWNSNSMEWYYQKKAFIDKYRLIMIDLPGLGKSKRPGNNDYSVAKFASDLDYVLSHINAKDAFLYGHSIGGMTILEFCTSYPESLHRISGIILQHTTYTNPVRTMIASRLMTIIQKPVLVPLCYLIIFLSPLLWVSRWMSYLNGNMHIGTRFMVFAGTQTFSQLDFACFLSAMAPPSVVARGVLGMFTYNVEEKLASLTIPSLIIAADTDRLTKKEASEKMNREISESEIYTASPAGHFGLVERHKEVNERLLQFLEKNQKAL